MKIGIIGAGHAGVAAAAAAREAGAEVILFSAESCLPYFRPRLVALAFGQVEKNAILMHPERWYRENDIDLRTDNSVASLGAGTRTVVSGNREHAFDSIVIAIGAGPAVPPFALDAPRGAVPLWNIQHAESIRRKTKPNARLVVIGGGVIGVESAVRAVESGLGVTVVEKGRQLMPVDFGESAARVLCRLLERKGIGVLSGRTVARVADRKDGSVTVELENGETIEAEIVLLCVGASLRLDLAERAYIENDAGIVVDAELRASAEGVFACGDVAQTEKLGRCSALRAVAQGRVAGANACASLTGKDMQKHHVVATPLVLRYGGLELYAIGRIPGGDCAEVPLEGTGEFQYRARVEKDGVTVGAQMIGSRRGFGRYVKEIQEDAL